MLVAGYYFSDQTDSSIDVDSFDDEQEAIQFILDAMKQIKNDPVLDTARKCAENMDFDQALYCIDTWIDEFRNGFNVFEYKIKEG